MPQTNQVIAPLKTITRRKTINILAIRANARTVIPGSGFKRYFWIILLFRQVFPSANYFDKPTCKKLISG